MNYDEIQEIVQQERHRRRDEKRVTVDDLLAMSRNNDPYFIGSPKSKKDGKWFAEMWSRFGFTRGVHIRRVHYAIVSASPAIQMPDGEPYLNTLKCYGFLDWAATSARYLDYVDPGLFEDHRNDEPIVMLDFSTRRDCEIKINESLYTTPDTSLYLPSHLPSYELKTFSEPQRYHLEIWCEKSTMNDILVPLAREYEAAYVYGKGDLSITLAYQAVRRFERTGKPVRIFYISDFDPNGRHMPVHMIRKVEYFLDKLGLLGKIDVRLFPVVLTPEQVRYYAKMTPPLLTTPLKDDNPKSKARAEKFCNLYGVDGGVELDALEIIHPGELRRILTKELDRYYDHQLAGKTLLSKYEAKARLRAAEQRVHARHSNAIEQLEQLEKNIQSLYDEQLTPLLKQYFDIYGPVCNGIEQELLAETPPDVSIEDVPSAASAEERSGDLFDSSKDYRERLESYKRYTNNLPILEE